MSIVLAMLAVVPIEQRPGFGQVLLSYLPFIVALLVGVVLVGILNWLVRRWVAAGVSRRAQFVVVSAMLAVLVVALKLPNRESRRSATTQPAGQWATFMCNPQRTGHDSGAGGPAIGQKIWTFRDGLSRAPFGASAAVVGGRVFVGSDNHQLYCLDADSGSVLWTFKAACELFASPVVSGGRVYLGEGLHHANNAKLYCLDAQSGRKVWEFGTTGHIEFSPSLFDGKLYFGAGGDGVYCVDAASGQRIWQYTGAHVDLSPVVNERGVFFGSVWGESAFYRLDPKDGQLIWKRPASCGVTGSPSTDGTRVFFGLGNGTFGMSHANPIGSVCCLSIDEGKMLWTAAAKDAVLTTVAVDHDRVYFGSRDGNLYCLAAQTGQREWAFQADEAILSSPAVSEGRVYFGCNDGLVYCVDGRNGQKLWTYDTSQAAFNSDVQVMASPAIANGRLYVGSMNFVFFCLGDAKAPATRSQ